MDVMSTIVTSVDSMFICRRENYWCCVLPYGDKGLVFSGTERCRRHVRMYNSVAECLMNVLSGNTPEMFMYKDDATLSDLSLDRDLELMRFVDLVRERTDRILPYKEEDK